MDQSSNAPQVVGVQISEKHVFSKTQRESIRLIENHGVEGDAHAGATDQHLYHIRRFGQQPNLRQVHLIQAELFDQVMEKGHTVKPGDLGENISTRGIPLLDLPDRTRLHLGREAVIELTGLRNPCHQIEDFQPGLLQHVVESTPNGLVRKGGVMAIVLRGGEVRRGDPIRVELPAPPHQPLIYRIPVLDLRITAIQREAEGIHSVELRAPDNGALPPFQAGAHIDLMLAPNLTRSYSLCNDPAERHRYVVSVNKDLNSRGGSRHVHEQLRVSDRLQVHPPRNNFPLDETAAHSVLIAGGIGITPLKAMMARLDAVGGSWELFYATRSRETLAFTDELRALETKKMGRVHLHIDAEMQGTRLDLAAIVTAAPPGSHFYCCGPAPMLDAFAKATAALPANQVHVEHFGGAGPAATEGGFKVTLKRSQQTLDVHPGATILDTLLAANITVPYACKEGVCGSCKVRVLEGTPDHRDLVLTPQEHARNDQMLACCSGSKSEVLVLDL
jgi:vanillate O-demethylase ferredoxin subunit